MRSYDDPSDAVMWVSAQLTDLDDDMFVTAFVARVDFTTGLVRFVNAGHPEASMCDSVNVVELPPTGPIIGPFAGTWTTREAIIGPGQMLVCYTDGLIEVRDEDRAEFGLERLHRVLARRLRRRHRRDRQAVPRRSRNLQPRPGARRRHAGHRRPVAATELTRFGTKRSS